MNFNSTSLELFQLDFDIETRNNNLCGSKLLPRGDNSQLDPTSEIICEVGRAIYGVHSVIENFWKHTSPRAYIPGILNLASSTVTYVCQQ